MKLPTLDDLFLAIAAFGCGAIVVVWLLSEW